MLPGAAAFSPPVATLTSLGSTSARSNRKLLVLEDDSAALVVLWDCRFRVGCEKLHRTRLRPRVRLRG